MAQSAKMYSPVFSSRRTTSGSPPVFSIPASDHIFSLFTSSFARMGVHLRPSWRCIFFSKRARKVCSRRWRSAGESCRAWFVFVIVATVIAPSRTQLSWGAAWMRCRKSLAGHAVIVRGDNAPRPVALEPGIGPNLAHLGIGLSGVFADGMLAAIDHGEIVSEEVHLRFIDAAVARGTRGFFVLEFICLGEARAVDGCALEVVGEQIGDHAVIHANAFGPFALHVDHVLGGAFVGRCPATLLREGWEGHQRGGYQDNQLSPIHRGLG